MDFTVIICTYNRSHNLPNCIKHLSNQKDVEDLDWEVLVVDNNSSDDTLQVVEELDKNFSLNLRYAFEPQQGLNHARNRGINESDSRYFCYIDDDILVDSCWLKPLYRALESHNADAVGGRIHLDANIDFPPWITPQIQGFLGFLDYGNEAFRMDGISKYPFGGNMSINRRVVDKIGLFNTSLGRRGEGLKRNELYKGAETDYFHRLAATGNARIFYEPRAIVYHQVLPHQLKRKYFLTIHYNAGLQKALHDGSSFLRRIFGIPMFIYPQLARATGRYLRQLITRGPNDAFHQLMIVGHFLGTMTGYRKGYRDI